MSHRGQDEWERTQHTAVRIATEERARADCRCCPDCNCPDGLIGWAAENIEVILDTGHLPRLYAVKGYDPTQLYTRCPTCGAAGEVLAGVLPLEAGALAEWIFEQQNGYIAPAQCRELCRLAVKIERAWMDDPPRPF